LDAGGSRRFRLPPWRLRAASAPPPAAATGENRVTLLADLAGAVPLPYGASALDVETGTELVLTPGETLAAPASSRLERYRVETSEAGGASPSPAPDCALAGPPDVLAALRPVALELVGGRDPVDALGAAAAIERHLRRAYVYSREVRLDPGGDPTV